MPQITEATIAMFKDKLSKGQHINSTCNEEKQLVFAWEELTQLRARVAELEKERDAAREEAGARRQDLADFTRIVSKTVDDLKQEIAAQQFVIEKMREALINIHQVACSGSPELEIAGEAIAIQPSTEALAAYVAEAVKEEREAILNSLGSVYYNNIGEQYGEVRYGINACISAIRARSDGGNG